MRLVAGIVVCVAVSVAVATAEAQRARGVIRDSTASTPLGGAVVLAVDSSGKVAARTIADSSGRFSLGLSPAIARLRFMRIGYRPVEIPVHQARDTAGLELRLARIPPMLDAVRVTEN